MKSEAAMGTKHSGCANPPCSNFFFAGISCLYKFSALESDTHVMAFEAGRKHKVRVNTISAGIMNQRSEDRPKGVGLNKRVRTSFADLRADNMTTVNPRQQGVVEKYSDVLSAVNGDSARIEEKIRRLAGEGWETKMKRKRSVAVVGN